MKQRTYSMVKPDGVRQQKIGEVIRRYEAAGLKVVALKMLHLSKEQAERFYAVHKQRPFFGSLVEFMTSGPVVAMCIEGENAIAHVREIMGATDPKQAKPGTIRADLATNIEQNCVHGSDAPETAAFEVPFFFGGLETF